MNYCSRQKSLRVLTEGQAAGGGTCCARINVHLKLTNSRVTFTRVIIMRGTNNGLQDLAVIMGGEARQRGGGTEVSVVSFEK
jgi:hypothetical protein